MKKMETVRAREGRKKKTIKKREPWKTKALKDFVIGRIEDGSSLRSACKEKGLNTATVVKWLMKDYKDEYDEAVSVRSIVMEDDILSEGDDNSNDIICGDEGDKGNSAAVARSRLKCDNRKWILSRMNPKRYGDQLNVAVADADKRIREANQLIEEIVGETKV